MAKIREPEMDPEVAEMIGAATNESSAIDTDAAFAAIEAGTVEDVVIDGKRDRGQAPKSEVYTAPVQGEPQQEYKKETKQRLIGLLAQRDKTITDLGARVSRLEAGTNETAIADLSKMFAMAISITGRALAAKRGPHWIFTADEKESLGEAWAIAAAPYAERIKKGLPLALAVGLTWNALEGRLEKDHILAADNADAQVNNGPG